MTDKNAWNNDKVAHGALLSFPWKADKPKLMVQHAYTLSTSWEWDVASTLRPNVAKLVLNAVLTEWQAVDK